METLGECLEENGRTNYGVQQSYFSKFVNCITFDSGVRWTRHLDEYEAKMIFYPIKINWNTVANYSTNIDAYLYIFLSNVPWN